MIRITLKNLIWLYFWLLILEGVLRKWVLPQLSGPLLIIRDPVLIGIYLMAIHTRVFPWNGWVKSLLLIGGISLVVSLFAEQNTTFVSLYGFRVNFLHFPLIFVIGKVMNTEDLIKIGRATLWLMFPMGILMMVQFLSDPESFVNATAGGEGTQITGTHGNIRPPGFFTFITGAAEFMALVSAFWIYGYYSKVYTQREMLIGATGLVLGLVVSISRLALSYAMLVVLMAVVYALVRPAMISRLFLVGCMSLILFLMLLQVRPVQSAIETFGNRITLANDAEGGKSGFLKRVGDDYILPFEMMFSVPLFGHGLGMGTAAGTHLLTGERTFLLAEGDWGRIMMESGPLLGAITIFWRFLLTLILGLSSLRYAINGNPLPLLIFGACNQLLLIGQISRPTTLGFTVFGAGLCVLAMKLNPKHQ